MPFCFLQISELFKNISQITSLLCSKYPGAAISLWSKSPSPLWSGWQGSMAWGPHHSPVSSSPLIFHFSHTSLLLFLNSPTMFLPQGYRRQAAFWNIHHPESLFFTQLFLQISLSQQGLFLSSWPERHCPQLLSLSGPFPATFFMALATI